MKLISLSLMLVAAALPVRAQDDPCFMIDSSGRYIPMGELCQGQSANQSNSLSDQERLARLFAQEFCSYRQANRPNTEAREAANRKIDPGSDAINNWESFYDRADVLISQTCPGL